MACGHTTSAADAEQLINEVDHFLYAVAAQKIAPQDEGFILGVAFVSYKNADGRLSFIGPRRLFDEFAART